MHKAPHSQRTVVGPYSNQVREKNNSKEPKGIELFKVFFQLTDRYIATYEIQEQNQTKDEGLTKHQERIEKIEKISKFINRLDMQYALQ